MNSSDRVILIIEDDLMIREIITTILECEEFKVIEAEEGIRGIELAEQLLPDLIICDITMPTLSGVNVLNHLKTKEKTAIIPFVFISAKAKKADVLFGLQLGADDYIRKPFTRDDLISTVKKCLEKKQYNLNKNEEISYVSQKINELSHKINQLIQTNSEGIFGPTHGWQGRFEQVVMTAEKSWALTQDLKFALDRNEFELYYQPQVNITSGKIIGAEALLRWQHPQRGLISPPEFMPIAEAKEAILPISDWVLTTVCQQAKTWQDMGLPLMRVAANISASQFNSPNFISNLLKILPKITVVRDYLELEVTESNLVKNIELVKDFLICVKKLGIQIAIDDFGTGYSSLNYLNNVKFDTLKISKLFVEGIDRSPKKQAIVKLMIELGHTLNSKVVAEGVETEAELAILKKQDCDEFQGYLFSRPLPVKEFEALLQANQQNN